MGVPVPASRRRSPTAAVWQPPVAPVAPLPPPPPPPVQAVPGVPVGLNQPPYPVQRVTDLAEQCGQRGLFKSGLKADVVARLRAQDVQDIAHLPEAALLLAGGHWYALQQLAADVRARRPVAPQPPPVPPPPMQPAAPRGRRAAQAGVGGARQGLFLLGILSVFGAGAPTGGSGFPHPGIEITA